MELRDQVKNCTYLNVNIHNVPNNSVNNSLIKKTRHMTIINFSRSLHCTTEAFKNHIRKQKKSLEPRSQHGVVIHDEKSIVKTTSSTACLAYFTFNIFNQTSTSLDRADVMVKFC